MEITSRTFEPLFVDEDPNEADCLAIWAGNQQSSATVATGILDHDYAHELVRRWDAHADLLEALKEASKFLGELGWHLRANDADAAIAKAEGR